MNINNRNFIFLTLLFCVFHYQKEENVRQKEETERAEAEKKKLDDERKEREVSFVTLI